MSRTKDEVLDVVRRIAVLADNPALGGGGMGARKISKLVLAFADVIDGEGDTEEDLKEFAEEVRLLWESHGSERRGQWQRIMEKAEKVQAKVKAFRERIKHLREHPPEPVEPTKTDPPADNDPPPT